MRMNRIVYLFTRRFYYVPKMFYLINKAGKKDKYTIEERYSFVKQVCRQVNKYAHVEIQCTGLNNLPKNNGYVITPNHEGLFDILLVVDTHQKPVSFVMRKDLENIPLLKQTTKAVDGKTIDRDDPRQGLRIISEMTKEMKEGRNFVIFPEGTRSKNEDKNIPGVFKGGTFKCAVRSKAPIVPVALIDSYKPFDVKDTGKVKVEIHYLPPIYYEEYKDLNTLEIASMVRERIVDKITNTN